MKSKTFKSETTIDILERAWKRYPLLKLNNFVNKDKTIKSFINNFLNEYKHLYTTSKVSNNEITCSIYCLRSAQDIYSLCRYYFKGCTLKEVFKSIFELINENSISGKHLCTTEKRYMFDKGQGYKHFYSDAISEYRSNDQRFYLRNIAKELGFNF